MDFTHRGYGGKAEAAKRCDDRDFLGRVATANLPELIVMLKNHRHKRSPAWKRACIERRIRRLRAAGSSGRE